jgi:hypothetical protein
MPAFMTAVKAEKFEESKVIESENPSKSTQTEIEAKEPMHSNLDLGFTVKQKKEEVKKPSAFAWVIFEEELNVQSPQTNSKSEKI